MASQNFQDGVSPIQDGAYRPFGNPIGRRSAGCCSQIIGSPYELWGIVRKKASDNCCGSCKIIERSVGFAGTFVSNRLAIKPSGTTVEHDDRGSLTGEAFIRLPDDDVVNDDLVSELDCFGFCAMSPRSRLIGHF